jgi:hypothetical protein
VSQPSPSIMPGQRWAASDIHQIKAILPAVENLPLRPGW